ncbi:hypothetical protein CICLE_v10033677mg, partial [Citrus x clementina]
TRNLLRIAIFNISYIRGLFPENYFNDKSVPALEMKIKKLMPMDAESRVYDALQKKYLKTLLFCVCEAVEGPMIEEYAFSFSYSDSDSQEISMNINRTGNKKKGGTFKCNTTTEITTTQMRSSACKMVRTLVQLMRTLDRMPEERTILMKLFYYNDVTPVDYEPPFFRCCSEEEAHNPWTKNPLKMEVGNVNSKHFVLALKVKSVLDPCEDENDDMQDDEVSLGADSVQRDESSDSDNKQQPEEDNGMVDEDNTQDPEEDEQQLVRVKDWINCRHLHSVELTDVLSNFPDISVKFNYEFALVKEEMDGVTLCDKSPQLDDQIYMKALYYALSMNYVTIAKLQKKLDKEANQSTVRKLIDKMIREGYVEAKGSRRLGKRVIHSTLTKKKLMEVKKALDIDFMLDLMSLAQRADLTFIKVVLSGVSRLSPRQKSETLPQAGPGFCISMRWFIVETVQPVASRESFAPGNEKIRTNGSTNNCDEVDDIICSRSTQDKRLRKTSTVKEPILQQVKRQKSLAMCV